MTRKLWVAGCSFSDYLPENRTVYGRELSELLGWEYQHEGAGAGSNWRIWRRIGAAVTRGNITDRDLVIIQYTGLERREFWSAHSKQSTGVNTEKYPTGGSILRYKAWAWQWQDHPAENKFFRMYEANHVNTVYEREVFDLQHLQFQLLLQHYGIACVFIDGRHTSVRPLPLISPFDQRVYMEPPQFRADDVMNYSHTDNSHLCDLGHVEFAKLLYEHVKIHRLNE
jgi:hypothetical protein